MAVILRSNMPYRGALADLPPINAPMPIDAALYGDFLNDLFITQASRGADPAAVLSFAAMRDRYLRNAAGGYTLAAEGSALRPEYDANGARLGMLVESSNSQNIAAAQRQELTQATPTGMTVSAGAATTPAWDRWYTLTPSGDAGHDLAFASTAAITANYRRTFSIEVRAGGHRHVQLSSGTTGEATDYANFDLQTRAVTAQGAGITYAAVLPTVQGAICYIQYASPTAAVETPTVSIIADGAAGKQAPVAAASVAAISARLPKLQNKSSGSAARVPPQSPMPGSAASVLSDRLNLRTDLVTPDFTFLVRSRNSPWVNSFTPSLFALFPNQTTTNGVSLRVSTSGALALVTRTSGTVATAQTFLSTLPDRTVTTFAFAKQGNTLRIAIPTETYEAELSQIAGAQPFILSSPVEGEGYDGHLQKIVGWSHGKPLAELQALVAEGL